MEFSTLGGWIATRASGMKKNKYGNIEDIVENATLVTPVGTLGEKGVWPRISNGPSIKEFILGNEGNYGIVTEAIVKIKKMPEKRLFDSILFYDFD